MNKLWPILAVLTLFLLASFLQAKEFYQFPKTTQTQGEDIHLIRRPGPGLANNTGNRNITTRTMLAPLSAYTTKYRNISAVIQAKADSREMAGTASALLVSHNALGSAHSGHFTAANPHSDSASKSHLSDYSAARQVERLAHVNATTSVHGITATSTQVLLGGGAGYSFGGGLDFTAIGGNAGSRYTGGDTTLIGQGAGVNVSGLAGDNNTGIGVDVFSTSNMSVPVTINRNTAIGSYSLTHLGSGSNNNTAVGHLINAGDRVISNSITIGYNSIPLDNTSVIGNSVTAKAKIFGNLSTGEIDSPSLPSVCGLIPGRPAVYDGAPGPPGTGLTCWLSAAVTSFSYDSSGLNPSPILQPFYAYLYRNGVQVTPTISTPSGWSIPSSNTLLTINGSTFGVNYFTPAVLSTYSASKGNNWVSVLMNYSGRSCRATLPIAISKPGAKGDKGDAGAADVTSTAVLDALESSTDRALMLFSYSSGEHTRFQINTPGGFMIMRVTDRGLLEIQTPGGIKLLTFNPTASALTLKSSSGRTIFSVTSTAAGGTLTL